MLAVALAWLAQGTPEVRVTLGAPVTGEITDEDPQCHTPTLDARYTKAPTVGRTFRLEVEETGEYTIELRAHFFDAYLVLRDESGALVGEDDDGLVRTQARLVRRLEAGRPFALEACALHGARGPFELEVLRGAPPELDGQAKRALELADLEARAAAFEARQQGTVGHLRAVHELVQALEAADQSRRALPACRTFLALAEELYGAEHREFAHALADLGRNLYSAGQLAEACEVLARALALRERLLGPEHEDTTASLYRLALVLDAQDDHAASIPLHERFLAAMEARHGPDAPESAVGLQELGHAVLLAGDPERARPLLERALSIREKAYGPGSLAVAETLRSLGVLRKRGEPEEARSLLERALEIRRKELGEEDRRTANSMLDLARVLREEGDDSAARPLLERTLALYERLLGPEHPSTCAAQMELASLLLSLADDAHARDLLLKSLAIAEKTSGPESLDTASCLVELGHAFLHLDECESARSSLTRALAIEEKAFGPDSPSLVGTLGLLSSAVACLGDLDASRSCAERSLALAEEALGPSHPALLDPLIRLGNLARARGDRAAAEALLERALAIHDARPEASAVPQRLSDLIVAAADLGRYDLAWQLLARDRSGYSEVRERILSALTESERFAFLSGFNWGLGMQIGLARLRGDPQGPLAAYDEVLRWKGRLGRLLLASRERLVAEQTAEQRRLLEELRACQGRLSARALRPDGSDPDAEAPEEDRLLEERNRLELELNRTFEQGVREPDVGAAQLRAALPAGLAVVDFLSLAPYAPLPWSAQERAQAVDPLPLRLLVWITRPDRDQPMFLDLGPAREVRQAVEEHLAELLARRGLATGEARAPSANDRLREILWQPLAAHLEGIETVVVSPNGFLGTLPFETLQQADGRYLLEDRAFVYVADVAGLPELLHTHGERTYASLLSVGGLDFDSRGTDEGSGASPAPAPRASALRGFSAYWGRLPATAYEAQVIADLHRAFRGEGHALLLQGTGATEERLKRELPRHAVLHLATHGFFQPEGLPSAWEQAQEQRAPGSTAHSDGARRLTGVHPGLLSGLVCSGANAAPAAGQDDGYLTAEELQWLDLGGVELAVLSACETGLGLPSSGEGLIGLRRACHLAGVRTVLSSLWTVRDDTTSRLMQQFYENLWRKGLGPLAALRAAQLALLRENRARHGDGLPSTWGAFVLSGEWR